MHWEQFTRIDLEGLTTPEVFERGLDYYRNGHVITKARIDDVLTGTVIGTGGDYHARLWIEDEIIQYQCSCPYPDFCKHLVALAWEWLESKTSFIDLRPFLDMALQDSSGLKGLFTRLVYQNPLNFMKLMNQKQSSAQSRTSSQTSREMLTLIRSIFQNTPLFRLSQVEALREKLTRTENLLKAELTGGNPDALPLFMEMLKGLILIHKENKLPELAEYIRGLLLIPVKTAHHFTKEAIDGLFSMALHDYFDPDLWEFKEELKEVLLVLDSIAPQVLLQFLMEQSTAKNSNPNHTGILNLISCYELLTSEAIVHNNAGLNQVLEDVVQSLKSTVEGRLWLIDRLMAGDPAESYRLARSALVGGMEPKSSFRNRLIMIHWRRGEFRQAASLSVIQFQEEPNFEEYLRLKEILKNLPADWLSYCNRLKVFLSKTGNDSLSFRIAIDQGDYAEIQTRLDKTDQTPASLLSVTGLILENGAPESAQIYPQLIRLLLREKIFSCWNAALKMLIIYKKLCWQAGRAGDWDEFRMELVGEHPDDYRFRRKFGGVLGMT